jgi:hypothetical protein
MTIAGHDDHLYHPIRRIKPTLVNPTNDTKSNRVHVQRTTEPEKNLH